MTERALDRLLRQVMLDAARLEYGELMEELPEHAFSPAFEKKMKKLVRRGNHPVRYQILHTAACLLLALLLSGCSVLALSAEAREAFTGWVREVYESSFIYRFSDSQQAALAETLYRPTYVPSGFRTCEEFVGEGPSTIVYENDSGRLAYFTCVPEGGGVFQVERNGTAIYKQITVNGMPAELYLDQDEEENSVLLWTDEHSGAIFWISAPFSETELVKMAESVEGVPVGYLLGWVPEGYKLVKADYKWPIFVEYCREDGEMVLLSVLQKTASMEIGVDLAEGDIDKKVSVSGRPADLYLGANGENSFLIWMDDAEEIVFTLNGALTEEEMVKAAESVRRTPAQSSAHTPAWLPEGYCLTGYSRGLSDREEWYDAGGGRRIWLRYGANGLTKELQRALEGLEPESVQVNGRPARLYVDAKGIRHLVWSIGQTEDEYWVRGPLRAEELIRVAESVGK